MEINILSVKLFFIQCFSFVFLSLPVCDFFLVFLLSLLSNVFWSLYLIFFPATPVRGHHRGSIIVRIVHLAQVFLQIPFLTQPYQIKAKKSAFWAHIHYFISTQIYCGIQLQSRYFGLEYIRNVIIVVFCGFVALTLYLFSVFLHVCRALAIASVILGFWGTVLTLIGMKCTKIGGSELVNARVTLAAAVTYVASGRTLY